MPIYKQLADSLQSKRRQPEFWFNCALFGLLGATFWPITTWLAETAHDQSRILHALIILVFASILLIQSDQNEVRAPFELNTSARRYLLAAYALLVGSVLIPELTARPGLAYAASLLSLPAYCCGLGACLLFVFGEGTRRITGTVTATFAAFLLLSILMGPLDWPLRALAGKWSGAVLQGIGQDVALGLAPATAEPPMPILQVNGHPFHVASECNGFGVMLTSVLLALLLGIHRRLGPIDLALNLVCGVAFGFLFNILRIVIIVLLAPMMMDHYMLMHEIVGTLTYWCCLVLLWILLNGSTRTRS